MDHNRVVLAIMEKSVFPNIGPCGPSLAWLEKPRLRPWA